MLKALQKELRELADVSIEKLRDEITKKFNSRATDEQVQAIKDFIFLMPPALKILSMYWSDKKTPAKTKKLAGLILTYVYHPNDYINDKEYGLFGYLDDAYLVVSSFLKIQDMYIRNWDDKSELERDIIQRSKRLINAPQIVIPKISERIDSTIDDWLDGKIDDMVGKLSQE